MKRLAALLCLVLCLALPGYGWTGQSCTSAHRIPITLTAGPAGHSGEIEVNLVSADFPASYVFSAAGNDVRVLAANDTTAIDFVVASWNATAHTARLYIRPPNLAANSSTVVRIYLGNSALAAASNTAVVFPQTGLRVHNRTSTADPTSVASGRSSFASATPTIYNDVRATLNGVHNQALGGGTNDYGTCVSAVFQVTSGNAGTWQFRHGGDMGRGGHLFVSGTQLEERWNSNLWWADTFADTFADTAQTLEGAITLAAGWHPLEILGFEDCCDGIANFQAMRPGGSWTDFNTTNFTVRAVQCTSATATVTVTKSASQSCTTTLTASKSVTVLNDPAGNASPFAVPGARVRYTFNVSNPGQQTDASTLVLADALPPGVALVVSGATAFSLIQGTVSSGLTLTWSGASSTTDGVEFSTDGINFNYTPVPNAAGTDPAVTHVRFRPTGTFAPYAAGQTPSFRIRFSADVK
jgi:uncharacterized repeat protein (TIGR01451 family)